MISDFYTIEDAMGMGLIPESYHSLFSKYMYCPDNYCGSPLIINTNRTVMKCQNPNCPNILASRVLKVYNTFGIMDFGPQSAYSYVVSNSIFGIPDALRKAPISIKGNIDRWLNSMHTAGELLELLAIPGIGSKAHKMLEGLPDFNSLCNAVNVYGTIIVLAKCGIMGKLNTTWWDAMLKFHEQCGPWEKFKGVLVKNSTTKNIPYDDYEEFFDDVKISGLSAVFERQLGGEGKDGRERAESVYLHWDEIEEIFTMTKCYPVNITTAKIIITGDIIKVTKPDGSMFERQEFINFINTLSLQYGVRYQNSVAFTAAEYIIADTPSNTRKYQMGMQKGNLITSDEFLKIIKERVVSGG